MTFLNHPNCPSWMTRDPVSKDPNSRDYLTLPTGTPFAFVCGSCYTPSVVLKTNLTISSAQGAYTTPLKGPDSKDNGYAHQLKNWRSCLLSYSIIYPESPGKVHCQLHRGRKVTTETFHYTTKSVETTNQEVDVQTEGTEEIECPMIDIKDKRNLVHVWHFPDRPGVATPSLDRRIKLKPVSAGLKFRSPVRIACSTYDFMNPMLVKTRTFNVFRTNLKIMDQSRRESGPQTEEKGPGLSLFTIIGAAAGFILLAAIIAVLISVGTCGSKNLREPYRVELQNDVRHTEV